LVGKYAFERLAGITTEVDVASEFRYRDPIVDSKTLVIAVSQSGETADTLAAVREAKRKGAKALAICNVVGSSLVRESHGVLYTHAGPEVAVASTKAFVAQVTALYLLGIAIAQANGKGDPKVLADVVRDLEATPVMLETVLKHGERLKTLAKWMADTQAILLLGRHVGYPIALEGALKLKELAYIHAEGFAAGELKHGPIALIEPGQVVFVIVPSPRDPQSLHAKVVSNIQEIRARGARVIAIAEQGDAAVLPYADEVIPIPLASSFIEPLLAVVPLHIFAMELAAAKGLDVDQPRNLAKSVTVE
jgi:glucosamine--fructose-6-phosphate aminotransferase (isomerizing)